MTEAEISSTLIGNPFSTPTVYLADTMGQQCTLALSLRVTCIQVSKQLEKLDTAN